MKKTKLAVVEGDVTHLIERLETDEEGVGVQLEALFAHHRNEVGQLTVNGEVHPLQGATIVENMDVYMDVYDSSDRLLKTAEQFISKDRLFGFEVFQMSVNLQIAELFKIRVYVAKRDGFVKIGPQARDRAREFESLVVGIKYHRGNSGGLTAGERVQLVREPDNIHDSNAVQVKLLAGELLGYIPSELAGNLAEELDAGMCAQARISRLIRKSVYLAIIVGKTELDIDRFVLQK